MQRAERILIFIPNWVGDVVMATPAMRAVRCRFPDAAITHLVRPYAAEVLAGTGFANDVLLWPAGRSGFGAFIWDMRQRRYDLALLLTNSFRSALTARLGGARRRVGYARDGRSWLLTDRLVPKRSNGRFAVVPALDYYNELAIYLGCEKVDDRLELAVCDVDEAALTTRIGPVDPQRPLVVLNPGAQYGTAKCWPPEYYASVADELSTRHGARVIASATPKEREIADRLAAAARLPVEVYVDPPLGLGPLKALIRKADLLITNDTGPRHFATAFGVPVITVFGSSDPAWTDTRYAGERIVKLTLECQPCMKRECPLKHHNCMRQLEPATVIAEAGRVFAEGRGNRAVEIRAAVAGG